MLQFVKNNFFLLFFLLTPISLSAQDEEKEKKWTLNGYVKTLQTIELSDLDNVLTDQLIHNRLNLRWYPNENWTIALEARNRIFFGELVKLTPNYGDLINDVNNDVFDLSTVLVNRNALVVHSMLDRAYVDWSKNKWQIRAGRQRINWGINLVWNPHDLFNTYSFLDFDYEERPGSDALRVQYYTNYASSIEFAVKAFDRVEDRVAAMLWKFNKWNYDFQLLGGLYQKDVAFGLGWAGSIGGMGFKGETSIFQPIGERDGRETAVALTLGFDYSVKNWYLNGGLLFNSLGENDPDFTNPLLFEISARNLSAYKYSVFTQASHQLTPLTSMSLSNIYSFGGNALIINPAFVFSLSDNWSLDIVGQFFLSDTVNGFSSVNNLLFWRLKRSF